MTNSPDKVEKELVESVYRLREELTGELHRRIVGQDATLDLILVALVSGGHCLITGVPGLAKTMVVKLLSEAVDLQFGRVQFTPDLMPSDITGTEVIEEDRTTRRRQFTFVKGPIFTNLLLADEVNRTPPKTQAALLQAMQEYHVTAMGKTYNIPMPFHVFATQNPIEQEGTYPLPEALLDRFMLSILMDYPSLEEERAIVRLERREPQSLQKIVAPERLREIQSLTERVPVGDHVVDFVVRLVRGTRPGPEAQEFVNEFVSWGVGPRAAQDLLLAARSWALLSGAPSPQIRHVVEMAPNVLRHRLVLNFRAETERIRRDDVIERLTRELS